VDRSPDTAKNGPPLGGGRRNVLVYALLRRRGRHYPKKTQAWSHGKTIAAPVPRRNGARTRASITHASFLNIFERAVRLHHAPPSGPRAVPPPAPSSRDTL